MNNIEILEKRLTEYNRIKNMKRSKKRGSNRLIARKKQSYQWVNRFKDFRNFETVVLESKEKMEQGFCRGLCVDKVKPLNEDKISFIGSQDLVISGGMICLKR